MLTNLSSQDVEMIIALSGEEIRSFLDHADSNDANPEVRQAIKSYRSAPGEFINAELVLKGKNIITAIHEPVRIEVRNFNEEGASQVVAKGIWGPERLAAIERIRNKFRKAGKAIEVRLAGGSSFEFNVQGVDKALAIRFVRSSWNNILDQINYTPGSLIDSRKTGTLIAADGDSTIYEGPQVNQPLPTMALSVAKESLIKFLESGGIFLLISGNDLDRSINRMKDGIPPILFNRILVAGNGGADLAGLNKFGQKMAIEGYGNIHPENSVDLDMVYIGDDGSPNGNDLAAFKEVGFNRSILVAKTFNSDYDLALKAGYVGGLVPGTKSFLERVMVFVQQNPFKPIFTIDFLKESADGHTR